MTLVSTEETDQPIPTATKSFKHAMKYIQLCLWGNNCKARKVVIVQYVWSIEYYTVSDHNLYRAEGGKPLKLTKVAFGYFHMYSFFNFIDTTDNYECLGMFPNNKKIAFKRQSELILLWNIHSYTVDYFSIWTVHTVYTTLDTLFLYGAFTT